MKSAFCEYIREEVRLWDKRKLPIFTFAPTWHLSEDFVEGPKGEILLNLLYVDVQLKHLYKTKDRLKKIITRGFNVYINSLLEKNKNNFNKSIADNTFDAWMKEIRSPRSSGVVVVPVIHLEINRKIVFGEIELSPIKQSGTVSDLESQIHKLFDYPNKRKNITLTAFSQSYFPYFMNASALKVKYVYKKTETFYDYSTDYTREHEEVTKRINIFITILRLFKDKDLRIENIFSSLSSIFSPSFIRLSGNLAKYAGNKYLLTDENEIRKFRTFNKKLFPVLLNPNTLPVPLQIGIEYFNSSFQKTKTHERFIDLMIALDALIGVDRETTYRLPLRAACLLEKDNEKRIEIVKKVKEALVLRGNIVHGDIHPDKKETEIGNSKSYSEETTRKIIVKLLTLNLKGELANNYKDKIEYDYIL